MKKIIILGLILVNLIILSGCKNENKENNKIVENKNSLLSYTIDGEKVDKKPTKEEGYIVNKIICDNGSDIMWDNDNWEVELTKVESKDRCKIDFTKDINTPGYRITITSNMSSALDSLSKATTENGTVKIYSNNTITNISGCNGEIKGNKVIINNITQNQTCNIQIEQTLANAIKTAYPPKLGRSNFSSIDNGTPGLYTGEDDQGTTYYFSGDGTNMNNWVSFTGKKWRIIRINGNGSVRLLYAGNGTSATDIGSSTYNSTNSHPAYVGWKYTVGGSLSADRGNANKSNAYSTVETWYNGLSSTNKNFIDTDAIYCSDRNLKSGSTYSTSSTFYYAAYGRLNTKKTPTFNCSNTSDRFTTFGLMTADEVAFAGGKYVTDSPKAYYYLAQDGTSSITGSSPWWTMTPEKFDKNNTKIITNVFTVSGVSPGFLYSEHTALERAYIRPVVSLKSNVTVNGGSGSASSPYEITLR